MKCETCHGQVAQMEAMSEADERDNDGRVYQMPCCQPTPQPFPNLPCVARK